MRSVPITLLAATTTALLAGISLAAPAVATPAAVPPAVLAPATGAYDRGPTGDPLETVARAYLASYPGLRPGAARTAASAQAAAGVAIKARITEHWDSFGGGWFDPHTASYHLAVTDAGTGRALARTGASHGVTVHTPLVDRSIDELEAQVAAIQAGTGPLARAAAGQVGIDIATNQVLAAVPAGQVGALARLAPAGVAVVPATGVDIELDACTSRADCDDVLASGAIIRNGDPGAPACSLGWTGRNSGNKRFVVTAGHCSTGFPQPWSIGDITTRLIGHVCCRSDFGRTDVSYIEVTNPFYSNDWLSRIHVGQPNLFVLNQGQSFLLAGDVACLSASFHAPATAGNPCGVVQSTNDPNGRNLVRIDGYDACPGDSGGGWYWLNGNANNARLATAVHSRSADGCNSSVGVSWASSINSFPIPLWYENTP